MNLVLVPFCLVSIFLYLGLILFGNQSIIWGISLVLGFLASAAWLIRDFRETWEELMSFSKSKVNLLLPIMVLAAIIGTGFSVSPFIVTKSIDGFEHIQTTDVGDYYKHAFVVNGIAQDGIPPENPYYPLSKLSYYYGYYLVPAFITRFAAVNGYVVTYWYSLFTNSLSLLLIAFLVMRFIRNPWYKIAALTLVVTGVGVDMIPFVFDTHGQLQNDEGLQLINVYKAMLFTPQHFLASALTVWTIYQLLYKKTSLLLTVVFSAMVLLSSIFVAITLLVWMLIIFVFKKELRWMLIKSSLITAALLIPYFLALSGRGNLFYLFSIDPYNYSPYYLVNLLYTFFIKYGPVVFLAPLLLFFRAFRQPLFIAGFAIILIMAWFIRSPIFNDFSMRTSIPVWLSLPVVVFAGAEKYLKKRVFQGAVLLAALVTVGIGTYGFYQETIKHYRARAFLKPFESELIQKMRTLPKETSLSSIDNASWVELMPSMASKKILSPYLFDSYVYFTGGLGAEHGEYESQASEIFHKETAGKDINDVIARKNQQLEELGGFFGRHEADLLILSNKIWVKKDKNPWVVMFKQLGAAEEPLTPSYSAFHLNDLLSKLSQNRIVVDAGKISELSIVDRSLNLEGGLWFLVSCNEQPGTIKLEPDDYYSLFDKTVSGGELCVGQLFYLDEAEKVTFTSSSSINSLYAAPVEILSK